MPADQSARPIQIIITDRETGEEREWWCSRATLTLIHRALNAYRYAPQYLADRFKFVGPRT